MQRPRRTSEFHEEPGTIKRQSRPQSVAVAPSPSVGGTANKYTARQSRYTNRGCSSADYGGSVTKAPSSSATRGFTPQKTPLTKPSANRALFTAEKHRTAGGGLHNDKKWVMEQMQRITEHLQGVGTVAGMSTEFLSRGLRQMSIKQFVAIINYFLGHIWGSRYTVGTNHVDDIVSILQKLQYPYQVNKSWLKTPNTPHSFGNVIVLFDFLMDFVPSEECVDGSYFEIDGEMVFQMGGEPIHITDLEFQKKTLHDSEEGFLLWDKNMEEEFSNLKKQTRDLLILKLCNIDGSEALNVELQRLEKTLRDLEAHRPVVSKEEQKQCHNLERELKSVRQQLKRLMDDYEVDDTQLKQMIDEKVRIGEEVVKLEQEIGRIQSDLRRQILSVEQRDKLIEEVAQLRRMLQMEERTLRDLQDRNLNQQVLLSRAMKQLNDQVELFNAHMREIVFSEGSKADISANLQLPLHPEEDQIKPLLPQLSSLRQKIEHKIEENVQQEQDLQRHSNETRQEIDARIEPKLNSLRSALASAQASMQELEQHIRKERGALCMKQQELKENYQTLKTQNDQKQTVILQKQEEVQRLEEANENTMKQAEVRHEKCVAERKAFLQAYNAILDKADVDMERLTEMVKQNGIQLQKLKEEQQQQSSSN